MIPLYQRPDLMGDTDFDLQSEYEPAGDQPTAIQELVNGLRRNEKNQVTSLESGAAYDVFTRSQMETIGAKRRNFESGSFIFYLSSRK